MAKKFFACAIIVFWLLYPIFGKAQDATAISSKKIFITELGIFEPADTEWVKILNAYSVAVDLTGWKFFEDKTNHGLKTTRGDFIIEPGEYAVITNKAEAFAEKYSDYGGTILDSTWGSLKEEGEEIGLKDSAGNFTEIFTYPKLEKTAEATFIERIDVNVSASNPANWRVHSLPTPAQPNLTPTISTPTAATSSSSPPPPDPAPAPPVQLPKIISNNVVIKPQNPAPKPTSTTPTTPTIPATLQIPAPQTLQIKKMPNGTFEICGYVTMVEDKPTATPKQPKTAKKSAPKNQPAKKEKTFQDGDLSKEIKITEIFPNPAENANDEWIEIENVGKDVVNLGNYKLADSAKKASPYIIPDTVSIEPNEYFIFPKTETHISLNNGSDEVFLSDFNGELLDSASYSGSQKGNSYALINIAGASNPLTDASSWEWTDEPTPSQPNPTFEEIEGVVSKSAADGENEFDITSADGETKKINFSEETLNPLLAAAAMTEGTSLSLKAKKQNDGNFELKKIDEVRPAPPKKEESNHSKILLFAGVSAIGALLGAIPLFLKLRARKQK